MAFVTYATIQHQTAAWHFDSPQLNQKAFHEVTLLGISNTSANQMCLEELVKDRPDEMVDGNLQATQTQSRTCLNGYGSDLTSIRF